MSNPALDEIVALAEQQRELERLVEEGEAALKKLKAQLRAVQEESLPLVMIEARMQEFTLQDGYKVKIKEDFSVGIPAARRDEAFSWLEEKGYGGLIKTEVTAEFGKGELDKAKKLIAILVKQNYTCGLHRDVHWQTLKAFINESVRENRAVPLDLFGATPVTKAEIKAPTKPKGRKNG